MILTSTNNADGHIFVSGWPTPASVRQDHVYKGTGSDHREAVEEWLRLYAPTWFPVKRLYYIGDESGAQYWLFIHPEDLAAIGREVKP